MDFIYNIPTKILFGCGRLNSLHKEKMPGSRALIVTTGGRSVVDNGYLARLEEELKAAGCTFVLYNNQQHQASHYPSLMENYLLWPYILQFLLHGI